MLTTNLDKALTEARLAFQEGGEIGLADRLHNVSVVLKSYSSASNADFFITDENGQIVASGQVLGLKNTTAGNIPVSFLEKIGETATYDQSTLDGFFKETHHTVAQHFYDMSHVSLYIFATSPVSQQDASVVNMLKLFMISIIVVLIICVVVVYVATLRLTAPIKEMAQTAKKIGEGDFSSQLPEYEITEFQELGHAINDMAISIGSYDKMRTSFVANVSHELRTPMTSIGGFVDGIIDGTIPPSQHKKYLGLVSTEIKRLTRLVKSMLNLAKIESGSTKPEFKMINVIEPIANSLFSFEDRINAKNLDIRGLDVDRTLIYADNDLVHQVMYNLIENAIKFANDGGYIAFEFEKIGDITEVSIANSGDGLSEEELPLVFDRFYKTDQSRGLDATGVGLGLNIVKSIVKLHGGTIRVTSVEGEYTKFIIQFKNTDEN